MVKGVSKQVILVHSPDKKLFDQAIFILSDDAVRNGGITDKQLLAQACGYIGGKEKIRKWRQRLLYGLFLLTGATVVGIIWLLCVVW